ncbi:response regulator [Flavobacterium sp. SORGH_AS_0622]|uniref:response regulator n=1 Tax=Flavobacterium sp. SORGH_AS_0622 TaxID=3041772 RepID=UPI00277FC2F9|nr:response regulator [Flavobacterium sp. SORGH_AS_0622]MDQ1165646.1 CheY-like chemotaxis protein [Flavobacterium sp. SORGH_AS_0622]
MAADNYNIQRYVYLADDDSDDRDFFADAMAEADPGVILKGFPDGMYLMEDLLALDMAALPDFVFLDINMPRKSGFECLEEIRKHEKLKGLTVVIHSTSSHPENIARAMAEGASFYAVKPSSFEKLKSVLEEILAADLAGAVKENKKFLLL